MRIRLSVVIAIITLLSCACYSRAAGQLVEPRGVSIFGTVFSEGQPAMDMPIFDQPVPGIKVYALLVNLSSDQPGEIKGITTLDEYGGYSFTGLPAPIKQYYVVVAYEPGKLLGAALAWPQDAEERCDYWLYTGVGMNRDNIRIPTCGLAEVRGRVVDESGQPVEGVRVRTSLNCTDAARILENVMQVPAAITDTDGSYRLDEASVKKTDPNGIRFLKASKLGYVQVKRPSGSSSAVIVLRKEVAPPVVNHANAQAISQSRPPSKLTSKSVSSFRGKVVDSEGKPVTGAYVCLSDSFGSNAWFRECPYTAAMSDGSFDIPLTCASSFKVVSDTLNIQAVVPHLGLRASVTVDRNKALGSDTVLKLEPGVKVKVSVVDAETGSPLPGVGIFSGWDVFVTDKNGETTIDDLYPCSLAGVAIIYKAGYSEATLPDAKKRELWEKGSIVIKLCKGKKSWQGYQL